MTFSFNLVDEPWIPCSQADGAVINLGIADVFANARSFVEIVGETPMVTSSLYRLLLTILHRAYGGPKDSKSWNSLWRSDFNSSGDIKKYLAKWRHRFDLFDHERPFMQQRDDRVAPKTIAGIMQQASSGNNGTLFDHTTDENPPSLTPAQAARFLLSYMAFGLGGTSAVSKESHTSAPSAGGILFMIQGESLQQTLVLNLVQYPDNAVFHTTLQDCPTWEMDSPYSPIRSVPLGLLDYLTWPNRKILLFPSLVDQQIVVTQVTVTPGLALTKGILDPMKHYIRSEDEGYVPLKFTEEKALWRDSSSLFQLTSESHHPPRNLAWVAYLASVAGILPEDETHRLIALGLASDKAKIEFHRAEYLPLPLAYLGADGAHLVADLAGVLERTNRVARQLWSAEKTLARFIASPDVDTDETKEPHKDDVKKIVASLGVERFFWSQLEVPFRMLLTALPIDRDKALDDWDNVIQKIARESFEGVTSNLGTTSRTLKAIVKSGNQLAYGLAGIFG